EPPATGTRRDDSARRFMPRDHAVIGGTVDTAMTLVLVVDVADVGAADARGTDLHQELTGPRLRDRELCQYRGRIAGKVHAPHGRARHRFLLARHARRTHQVSLVARERFVTRTFTSTAATMITPRTTFCRNESTPSRTRPLLITVMNTTPSSVPGMHPRPPAAPGPPMTTAAITSNSRPDAAPPLPDPRRAANRIPVIADSRPVVANSSTRTFARSIPAIRAAG